MIILVFFLFLFISLYFLNRLRKYPTERGLRLPTLFSIPPFFLRIPLIRAANSFLRFNSPDKSCKLISEVFNKKREEHND